ncbi:MAG: S1C family serine protease [Lachnospiraceae bacterium]|nr:S1C family serine protease [Lachnospiraceae bacterium]
MAKEEKNKNITEEKAESSSDYEFLREQIKDRPINRRKLLRRMLMTAGYAIVFGAIACGVFVLLLRSANKRNENESETVLTRVELPTVEQMEEELPAVEVTVEDGENLQINQAGEENEKPQNTEIPPEETVIVEKPIEEMTEVEEEPPVEIVEIHEVPMEIELSDYQLLYQKLNALAKEVGKSMVTITYISDNTDWLDDSNWYKNHASGMILGDNGQELLVLAMQPSGMDNAIVRATFPDGTSVNAMLKQLDKDTSLAVYGIKLRTISKQTLDSVTPVTLGNSTSASVQGSAVVAVGSPLGNPSVCYGAITSKESRVQKVDATYQILTTDIYGSVYSGGILVNTKGQVVGIICNDHKADGMENLIYAYGITGIRKLLENLSNGANPAYLGIVAGPVSEEAMEALSMPAGVYVIKTEMNSPAMAVGIAAGDIITAIGDTSVSSPSEYMSALALIEPGQPVSVTFMRLGGGEYRETKVSVETQGKYETIE